MPQSASYKQRLFPNLQKIVDHYGTPFHIYDEKGIEMTCKRVQDAFAGVREFKEFYAVKALPNPTILTLLKKQGFGFDCSSIAELRLARQVGALPDDIMFTSNNTSAEDFAEASLDGGCIVNLDDLSFLDKLSGYPSLFCVRYNPGAKRTGNEIIGNPLEAKYGLSHDQILPAYRRAKDAGCTEFGLHTMLASNELNYSYMVETAKMLLDLVEEISAELSISFSFINIGGGLGIPYQPDDQELDIEAMGQEITTFFKDFEKKYGYQPALYMESGRYITGPHGVLVTKAINSKDIYRRYVGVDACMSSLMRPGMYGAYHHIDVVGKIGNTDMEVVDVVGSLCENNDKFAIQRNLPKIDDGDLIVIEDTGAHGIAMGFNYNGSLRPKELLLRADGNVELIRRKEEVEDYFTTLSFTPDKLSI